MVHLKLFSKRPKAASRQSVATTTSTTTTTLKNHATFLSLPAELRNEIYALVALSTNLCLPRLETQHLHHAQIPGLLLANKQVRREALPILLSTSRINATVWDLDFKILREVVAGLYFSELRALKRNDAGGLWVRLRFSGTGRRKEKEVRFRLWKWCDARVDSLDRLGWGYVLCEPSEGSSVLPFYADVARAMHAEACHEIFKQEVRRILEVLDAGIDWGDELQARGAVRKMSIIRGGRIYV